MKGRAIIFSLVAPAVYIIADYFGWSPFQYYPVVGRASFAARTDSGFAILWYGWVATAILAGALAAFVVPRRWSDRLPLDLCWMMLVAALFAVLIYEKRWFF